MIFGTPGSGKSTFAHLLHQALGIPLYHLDKYYFENNWVERNYEEFLSIQQNFVDQDDWIIDGNSIKSLEMRYSQADVAIYFNYPKLLCYARVFKRLLMKNHNINDRAPGCNEGVSIKLLKYMWSFEQRVSPQIQYLKDKYHDVEFIEIKNDEELKWLKDKLLSRVL
jgi:adenylate kinase family enzyme